MTNMIKSFKDFIIENNQQFKKKQLDIILQSNPMHDDYHTGIRTIDDILTFYEASKNVIDTAPDFTQTDICDALTTNMITIYSSYEIKPGVFVTPSKMMAKDYAGSGKIYSKTVSLTDVAWIDTLEGQYVGKL